MLAPMPSLAPFETDDDDRLLAEHGLALLRSQIAIARGLVEYLSRPGQTEGLRDLVIEETTRLAYHLLETARSLAGPVPEPPST